MFRAVCRAVGLGRGGRGLRWLRARVRRRSAVLFLLLWLGSWLFLSGLLFVHTTMFSDFCTDDKSKKILQRLVGHSGSLVSPVQFYCVWVRSFTVRSQSFNVGKVSVAKFRV